jgi:hypothetical protein
MEAHDISENLMAVGADAKPRLQDGVLTRQHGNGQRQK